MTTIPEKLTRGLKLYVHIQVLTGVWCVKAMVRCQLREVCLQIQTNLAAQSPKLNPIEIMRRARSKLDS